MGKAEKAQMKSVQKPTTTKPPTGLLQRKCDRCREKEKKQLLQRLAFSSAPATVPPIVHEVLGSPGQPLDKAEHTFTRPRFSYDFSQIPVLSGSQASIQAKLTINAQGDIYEREADRVADQVLATPPVHHAAAGAPMHIQRFVGQPVGQSMAAPASVDRVLASPGRPLPAGLRQEMEGRFGHDFSGVRVHTDTAAQQSAMDVNAHAYTVGHNIVFGAGQFAPGTPAGKRLLADHKRSDNKVV